MSDILFDIQDHVALITLNRPHRKNAYTREMSRELGTRVNECDGNDDVRAVVITGAGDSFCVGFDLDELKKSGSVPEKASDLVQQIVTYPFQIRKPVICAINGSAGGFGAAYPLVCDMRIVDRDATIGFTFVRQGLVPEMACTFMLPHLFGLERANEVLLTGRRLKGQEAADMGYALRAVEKDQVLPEAMKIASEIAATSAPVATAMTKRMIWSRQFSQTPLQKMILDDRSHFIWSTTQADAKEGVKAFLEKRPRQWAGQVSKDLPHFASISQI